jgi:hypothetical protein
MDVISSWRRIPGAMKLPRPKSPIICRFPVQQLRWKELGCARLTYCFVRAPDCRDKDDGVHASRCGRHPRVEEKLRAEVDTDELQSRFLPCVVIKEDMRFHFHLISPLIVSETAEQVNPLARHARRPPGPHEGRHGRQGSRPGGAKDELAGTLHEPFLVIDFQVSGKPLPTFLASATEPSFLDATQSLPSVAWIVQPLTTVTWARRLAPTSCEDIHLVSQRGRQRNIAMRTRCWSPCWSSASRKSHLQNNYPGFFLQESNLIRRTPQHLEPSE